jgi:hypothetical protein
MPVCGPPSFLSRRKSHDSDIAQSVYQMTTKCCDLNKGKKEFHTESNSGAEVIATAGSGQQQNSARDHGV